MAVLARRRHHPVPRRPHRGVLRAARAQRLGLCPRRHRSGIPPPLLRHRECHAPRRDGGLDEARAGVADHLRHRLSVFPAQPDRQFAAAQSAGGRSHRHRQRQCHAPAAAAERVNWKILRAAVALDAFFAPAPAQAQAPPAEQKSDVALALVLAVDASGSVDNRRFELQKQGYAAAFRSPKVLNSIRSLITQSIAVTMVQWTGPRLHVVVVDWMPVKAETSVTALAGAIEAAPRKLLGGGTSISAAIDYPPLLLAHSPPQ